SLLVASLQASYQVSPFPDDLRILVHTTCFFSSNAASTGPTTRGCKPVILEMVACVSPSGTVASTFSTFSESSSSFAFLPTSFFLSFASEMPFRASSIDRTCTNQRRPPKSSSSAPSSTSTPQHPECPALPPMFIQSKCLPLPGSYFCRRLTRSHCRANS